MSEIVPFGAPQSPYSSLVPRHVRRELAVVQARGLIGAEQLDVLESLIGQASNGAARMGMLHEALIKVSPLADDTLARLRGDYGELARKIIKCSF